MQTWNKFRALFALIFITSTFFVLGACSSSDDTAYLRVVHLSPDAPEVDVLLDDKLVLERVPYPVASDYLGIDPGLRDIKINASGTDLTVIQEELLFLEHSRNTILATGLLGSADLQPLVLLDRPLEPLSGSALVRVVHGAPSAPNVDVYVTEPGAELAGQSPVLENVPFRAVSDYLTLPAGAYQALVTLTGTNIVAIDSGALNIESGDVLTIIARESSGGGAPFSVLVLIDD
jgi:hypothetical protein